MNPPDLPDLDALRAAAERIAPHVHRTPVLTSRLLDAHCHCELFFKAENLFDEQAIVSRQPDGARPNKPRTASLGFNWMF